MVYTRILFNNIKEYTPNFIRTVPYSACVKPALGYKPNRSYKMFRDPKVIRLYARIKKYIIDDGPNYQILFFMATFAVTAVFFYPMLYIYQSNNAHRQLDYVIALEKVYKDKKAAEEEAEAGDEAEEEPEAEEKEEKVAEEKGDAEEAEDKPEDKPEEKADGGDDGEE